MARDVYSWKFKFLVKVAGAIGKLFRVIDIGDQVEAARRIFASDKRWTVVRGSDLEEGESEGLPIWSKHVGDPILESNMTRRMDFALFMVEALTDDALVHEAPAIVGCQTPSALETRGGRRQVGRRNLEISAVASDPAKSCDTVADRRVLTDQSTRDTPR